MNLRSVGKFGWRSDGGREGEATEGGRVKTVGGGGGGGEADKTDENGKEKTKKKKKKGERGLSKKNEPHASQQVLPTHTHTHTQTHTHT